MVLLKILLILQCIPQLVLFKLIECGLIIKEGSKHMPCSLRKVLIVNQVDSRMAWNTTVLQSDLSCWRSCGASSIGLTYDSDSHAATRWNEHAKSGSAAGGGPNKGTQFDRRQEEWCFQPPKGGSRKSLSSYMGLLFWQRLWYVPVILTLHVWYFELTWIDFVSYCSLW